MPVKRLLVLLVVVALASSALAACGGGDPDDEGEGAATAETSAETGETTAGGADQGDPEAGAEVFASAGCGSCHTLAAADATGTRAPNLDQLQPTEAEVAEQVRNGGGGMPAFDDRLSDQEIADVAAFVAANAGS